MKNQLILTAASVDALSGCTQQENRPKDLNVIYILADDLGYGDLGCYGQTKIHTPNIDRLAAEGMLFTQHYAGCTVSAPSRSALMTGQHTGHTPIRGNKGGTGDDGVEGQHPIPADTYTLGKMFRQAGYVTGTFGNGDSAPPDRKATPPIRGSTSSSVTTVRRSPINITPHTSGTTGKRYCSTATIWPIRRNIPTTSFRSGRSTSSAGTRNGNSSRSSHTRCPTPNCWFPKTRSSKPTGAVSKRNPMRQRAATTRPKGSIRYTTARSPNRVRRSRRWLRVWTDMWAR